MGIAPLNTLQYLGSQNLNAPLLAVVDIGSNSIHLEAAFRRANKPIQVIHERKVKCQLAAGLDADGALDGDAIERGREALALVKADLDRLAPDFVAVVATHAVRTASNGQIFAQEVEHLLGVPCEMINGTSEAELVLLGTAVTEQVTDALAVIDVGGGSTEIALGEPLAKRSPFSISLPVGCVTLRDRFECINHPDHFASARASVRRILEKSPLAKNFLSGQSYVFATSGTARALAKLALGHCSPTDNELVGFCVRRKHLEATAELLIGSDEFNRQDFGIGIKRSELLGSGLSVMLVVMSYLGVDSFRYSRGSVRHGILYKA